MIVHLNESGGYWKAVWTDELGRRRSRGLGNANKVSRREATKMCAAIAAKEASNPSPDGKAPTLKQWREKYLELRDGELSEGTLYLHGLTFDYLIRRFGENTRIDRITKVHAAEWAAGLGLSEQSTCLHVRNAKVLFGRAVDLDIIGSNPFKNQNGTPPAVDKDWEQISDEQVIKLIEACPNDGWRHLFALCRWAGLRRGEALRLRWADIDWTEHTLTVTADATTTKAKRRTVPIVPELYGMLLRANQEAAEGSIGPTDEVLENNLHRNADVIIERAGLPKYTKPFHTLRKCCESAWMAEYPVMDVVGWMGHSATVASKHYTRATDATLERITGRSASILHQTTKETHT